MAFLCVSCGRAVSILDSDFSLDHVIEVEGRQGVATDGDFYYISGSTALYKYDMKGNLVAKNENPFKDLQLECNHIGDIDEYDGEIYAGCEFFLDGVGRNIQTAIYDAATLEYKRSIPWVPESGQVECCGLTVDRDRKEVWMADDFILTGEIEGLTMNPKNGDLIVMSNRGARIILGMPKGFYPGYDREIHDIYIYTPDNSKR